MRYFPHHRPERGTLFNPVLKKEYANRPEERVRLALVDEWVEGCGISPTRIGFELPVPAAHKDARTRADLVLYDEAFRAWFLVECKAGSVAVDEAAAVQAAQYNRVIDAPWVGLTNGRTRTALHGGEPAPWPLEPRPVPSGADYWVARGFLGHGATAAQAACCERLYRGPAPVRWLDDPLPGWATVVGGLGCILSAGRVVLWNTGHIRRFELPPEPVDSDFILLP